MGGGIAGEMVRVDVHVETYDARISPDAGQEEEFRRDPESFMRRFLEEQGHKVNDVKFILDRNPSQHAASDEPIVQRMPDRHYHIVFPDNEASGWICCCA
jgi:cupin superfamily acireductone dioxygenase involved in methionine salvage